MTDKLQGFFKGWNELKFHWETKGSIIKWVSDRMLELCVCPSSESRRPSGHEQTTQICEVSPKKKKIKGRT